MRKTEDYIAIANEAVERLASQAGKRPAGLYEPIAYGLEQGGKRLRPVALLAACDAVGGSCEAALSQAAAVEMFHNFTLLHDDVMDNADLRRGKPTVCRKWGDNTAILSGDTMLTLATGLMVDGVEPSLAVRLLREFNAAAVGVYEGQQLDMEFEARDAVSIEEYVEMIRLKTAVLLAMACRVGALVGGASDGCAAALSDFATNLGLAFQLQDDWLDVYADPKVFGKAIGGDILNNKKTFLLINARELASGADKEELERWLADPAPFAGEKIAAVTAIYDRLRVGELCQRQVGAYCDRALEALADAGLDSAGEAFFREFAAMVMGRKR